MSVTINKNPQGYMPAYNDNYFEAESDQTAQPGFMFDVRLEELETGRTQEYRIPPIYGTNEIRFDAGPFARAGLTSRLMDYDNSQGWRNYNRLGSIRVNIGETYDGSPEYHAGSNFDYKVWNAQFRKQYFKTYNQNNWIFNADTNNVKVLSSTVKEKVVANQSTFIHLINRNAAYLEGIRITYRDINLNTISSSIIYNLSAGSGLFEDEYLCIDIGPNRIQTYDGGIVTGAPFPTGTVYYDAELAWANGSPLSNQYEQFIKRYQIVCEPTFTVYPIHYLSRSGAFDTCLFSKQSLKIDSNEKTNVLSYRYLGGNDSTNGQAFMDDTVLSSLTTERFRLNTFHLNEDEIEKYRELIDSTVWYMEVSAGEYVPVVCEDASYEVKLRHNRGQKILTANFKMANKDGRQNG